MSGYLHLRLLRLLRLGSVTAEPLGEAPVRLGALRVRDLDTLLGDLGELVL